MHIINLIRLKDWLKNILIFFPLIYSGLLFDGSYYTILILGFITFCIVSSCIYILNDILDFERDSNIQSKNSQNQSLQTKSLSNKLIQCCLVL